MSGRVSAEQVERAVSDNIDRFEPCTTEETTVTVRALIGATGKVVDASSARSAPDDARLRDCVVAAFRDLTFPSSTDGRSAPIVFDLVLSPPS